MTEPRTEAGRRLLADLPGRYGGSALDPISHDLTRDAILAIEAEAAAGPREGLDVEQLARAIDAVLPLGVYRGQAERIARKYAAGPRDEGLAKAKPAIHKPDPTNVATWTMFEAAAGPRDVWCGSCGERGHDYTTCDIAPESLT